MECEERVYSNEYYDLLFEREYSLNEEMTGICIQNVDAHYGIRYVERDSMNVEDIMEYTYLSIPKCFTLLDQSALEVSGILQVQNQPTLALKGEGILIGFLDTGIDYTNPIFQNSDGSTRIVGIWDQTIRDSPPDSFIYGTEYTREEINQALRSDNPLALVPSVDELGHGTFLAGVAAGGADYANDFIGAAPLADIAVVKLKQAKSYLREYYFIPEDTVAFAENDMLTGVYYLNLLAQRLNRPLVLCLALGGNMGSHSGNNLIANYLDDVARRLQHVVVIAAGNEANERHHYRGRLDSQTLFDNVEISVGSGVTGFIAELWVNAPELYTVTVTSPTGETISRVSPRVPLRQEYRFVFEETTLTLDYRITGLRYGDQLINFRFEKPTRGIWSIQVYGITFVGKDYHIWLPMRSMVSGDVFFIRSDPNTTITVPANGPNTITVGGYDARDGSLFIDSGRGFTVDGRVKPEFTAPGVNVYGPTNRGTYQTFTGTSASAAITAGASAQFMEYAIDRGRERVNTLEARNFFVRGAVRDPSRTYPNREWGYGKLDIYNAFEVLRSR